MLTPKRKGIVEDIVFGPTLELKVKGEGKPIINEIRKRGVIIDRNKDKERLQVRIGDVLVVYNSIRVPESLQAQVSLPLS